jgi:hypothetical protein
VLEGQHADLPVMLTEFGGIALSRAEPGSWGYTVCGTPEEFARQFESLLHAVRQLGVLAGFCYTQFSDTYQEINGLLYADRTPKIPIRHIAEAIAGPSSAHAAGGLEQIHLADAGEPR